MSLHRSEVNVDARAHQIEQHGDAAFPLACYQGDLVANSVMWHWHDDLELILISEGNIAVGVGTDVENMCAGDACFINSGILHSVWRADDNACFYRSIVFQPRLIGSMESIYWIRYVRPLSAPDFPQMIRFRASHQNEAEIISLLSQAWETAAQDKEGYEIEVRYIMTKLLCRIALFSPGVPQRLSGKEYRDMERIKQMLSWLEEHFSENVTVKQIAQSGNISESECLRCFKRNIGCSPIQYLVRYRLRQAAAMIAATDQNISDIAVACGFLDMSYFSRSFKILYSMTPTEYKAKCTSI
ncbi:MAG: helix-turn-helix transcriptional regulator [Lachnospiraceae bacterium]|nr:helix-turn-helix transcriptional regulator [Lachnospiraceae bacterium]